MSQSLTVDLENINPKYRFSKMITDAKSWQSRTNIEEKKSIIKILISALIYQLRRNNGDLIDKADYIVHIPKTGEESSQGQFRHSFYYAKKFSEGIKIPFLTSLLKANHDKKYTADRFSFLQESLISGKNFFIIDDVYTSGDTSCQISQLLKDSGAAEIDIIVIGRTSSLID